MRAPEAPAGAAAVCAAVVSGPPKLRDAQRRRPARPISFPATDSLSAEPPVAQRVALVEAADRKPAWRFFPATGSRGAAAPVAQPVPGPPELRDPQRRRPAP